jgi:FkbM family methyltransferase
MKKVSTATDCKYGTMSFYDDDHFIGRSLALYGEYSDYEAEVFRKCLKPGDVAMEVGSNIGSLTIPMAQCVGSEGKVYAFEPGVDNIKLLRRNVEQNDLNHVVEIWPCAASDKPGTIPIVYNPNPHYPKLDYQDNPYATGSKHDGVVDAVTIDSLNLQKLKFVKIDVDGCEQAVLDGMAETIKRCRPIVFIENEVPQKAAKIVATLVDAGYRGFWYTPPLFRVDNYKKVAKNIFPGTVSLMQIYVPDEEGWAVKGCDDVPDIRMDDAIFQREADRYSRYVERNPDDLGSRLIVAHYLGLMQKIEEADALMDENLRRQPDHIPTQAVRGLHELQKGNFKEGWQGYELRFHQKDLRQFGGHRKPVGVPKWDGSPTDDAVLIWSEQGYGDTIMFSRFFRHVLERAPNAILEVQPELYELMQFSGVCPDNQLFRLHRSAPRTDYKYQCSLPSTPAALGDDGSLIPSDTYLFADGRLRRQWKEIINGRAIGACWEGSPRSERPYTRNVSMEDFRSIDTKYGPVFSLVDGGQFDSFAATAAAIMELDLVITVDTSIAHLAGALGKDVWLLLAFDPDFRWGLTSDKSIWYPSMRIFRQKKLLDWKGVMTDVDLALQKRYQTDSGLVEDRQPKVA